jgi:hypothetical protein
MADSGIALKSISGCFEVSDSGQFVGKLSLGLGESRPRISSPVSSVCLVVTSEIESVKAFAIWVVVVETDVIISLWLLLRHETR